RYTGQAGETLKQFGVRWYVKASLVLLALSLVSACSTAPYRYESLDDVDFRARAESQVLGDYHVRAVVPSADETKRLFGAPLYDRGIQPVWFEIYNASPSRARVSLSSVDPKYFPPMEVAYIFRKQFSKQGWKDMETHLHASGLPRQVLPGQTVSGYVFTNLNQGTKAFNLDIFDTTGGNDLAQFMFFLQVPGFVPDHAEVEFKTIYAANEIQDVDQEGLRTLLHSYPCCTRNRADDSNGRPVDVFLVANGADLLRALLRAGWSETSYARDENYLSGAQYLFGRTPDAIFRKGRNRTRDRLELSLWLAPARVSGQLLWAGQVRHAVGRRFEIGDYVWGVNLDPDASDGRNYLLQDLWYSQSLLRWGWSESGIQVSPDDPVRDFNGNPWFTRDALRSVIWVSGRPTALSEARLVDWFRPATLFEEER
ncbi:MAG: LssY C-terminal domain-containing protein, partial [Lysobacterales bacterium]